MFSPLIRNIQNELDVFEVYISRVFVLFLCA